MSTFLPHLLTEAYKEVYKQNEVDSTDIVLGYLIDEGYAVDEDDAFDIFEQLDDATVSNILDEVRGCGGKVDPDTGKYENGESAGMMLSPRTKARAMANRRENEGHLPRHRKEAAKMRKTANSMREDVDTYDVVLDEGRIEQLTRKMTARYGKPESRDTLRQHVARKKFEADADRSQFGNFRHPNQARKDNKLTRGQMMYKANRSAEAMRGERVSEDVDTYDVVLDYLLDEGYADTEEAALVIMSNMSEAWVDNIIDEAAKTVMSVTSPTGKKRRLNTTKATSPARILNNPIERDIAYSDSRRVGKSREGVSFTPSAVKAAKQRAAAMSARQRAESDLPSRNTQNRRDLVTMKKLQRKYGIPDNSLD